MEQGYLIFSLQGRRYALEVSRIAAVNDPPPVWPVPAVKSPCVGAMSFRGSIVAVVDGALLLGLPSGLETEKVVILDHRRVALALLVEQVLKTVPEHQVERVAYPVEDPYISHMLMLADGDARLLDTEKLIAGVTTAFAGVAEPGKN